MTGDFKTLFDFLRENPSEKDPDMVIPDVVDPAEVEGPYAPKNLAAILKALEDGDSDLPAPEYGEDVHMEGADAEDRPAEDIPAKENPSDDLTMEHAMEASVENAVPVDRSLEA